jgi:hypothetical protein
VGTRIRFMLVPPASAVRAHLRARRDPGGRSLYR